MQAIRMAEALQILANTAIKEDFSAEDQKELSLERMTYDTYMKELQSAVKNGTLDDFNDKLRKLLTPIISQVMQATEQQPQQGGIV